MEPMLDPSKLPARLPLVDQETAPPAVREAFALLPAINLFRAMANATSLYPDYIRYVNMLFKHLELDSGLERMVVLHVARASSCLYAWRQNVVVAKSVGVSDEQIAALEGGRTGAPCFDERQQATRLAPFGPLIISPEHSPSLPKIVGNELHRIISEDSGSAKRLSSDVTAKTVRSSSTFEYLARSALIWGRTT